MSDEQTDGDKRPNSNYQLSNSNNESSSGSEIIYHYSRERRLAKAPQSVRDIYNDEPVKPRFGLLGPLIADKPRRILFFMIIFLCVMILALSALGFFDDSRMLDGNRLDITGTIYENTTIVILKKTVRNADAYTGAVDIAVSPSLNYYETDDEKIPVFYHRIFFSMENEEIYRFAVPYDTPEFLIVVQNEKSDLQMKIKSQ